MPPDQRILAFYLIDSIVNSEQSDTSGKKSSYKSIFGNLIGGLFMETYLKLPQVPELRNLFARLLDAWTKSERFEKSVLNSLNARFVSVRSLEMTALPRPSQTFYRVQQQQPVAPSAPYYPQQNSGQPFYNSYNNVR